MLMTFRWLELWFQVLLKGENRVQGFSKLTKHLRVISNACRYKSGKRQLLGVLMRRTKAVRLWLDSKVEALLCLPTSLRMVAY